MVMPFLEALTIISCFRLTIFYGAKITYYFIFINIYFS